MPKFNDCMVWEQPCELRVKYGSHHRYTTEPHVSKQETLHNILILLESYK